MEGQGERKENTFRKTVLFIVGFVAIVVFDFAILVIELPIAIAIGLIRNRWAIWVTPRAWSLVEKLEEYCFPGWQQRQTW